MAAVLLLLFLPLLCFVGWFAVLNKNSPPVLSWPIVGMLPSLLLNVWRDLLHELNTRAIKESGGTFLVRGPWFAGLDYVITADPINVHHVLTSNFKNYPKGSDLNAILKPLGDGIFNADGESWKSQRETIHSLINTAQFHQVMLKTLHHKLQNGLIPILHNASNPQSNLRLPPLDLQELMKRLTFDTICTLVLGFDPEYLSVGLPSLPYADAFDVIEEVILYRHCVPAAVWKFQRWAGIGEERKMREAQECFDGFLEERIIVKKTEALEKKKKQGKQGNQEEEAEDFLTMILLGKGGNEGNDLTNVFLRDIVFNLMVAGRDTIAAALSWFFWLVATNPNVEEKILKEIDRVIGTTGEKETSIPSTEELNQMIYLHGAICETLRLYPSVPYEHKQSIEPDVLPSGHAIDSKTKILVSIYSMGRMEQIWGPDWMEFKPERWISAGSAEKKKTTILFVKHVPAYKFAAFMAGPRTCVGRKIAFIQMKAIAICLLRRFKIEVVDGHPVVPDASILMFMKYGLKVRVSNRA